MREVDTGVLSRQLFSLLRPQLLQWTNDCPERCKNPKRPVVSPPRLVSSSTLVVVGLFSAFIVIWPMKLRPFLPISLHFCLIVSLILRKLTLYAILHNRAVRPANPSQAVTTWMSPDDITVSALVWCLYSWTVGIGILLQDSRLRMHARLSRDFQEREDSNYCMS
jgi:hypothetical protein